MIKWEDIKLPQEWELIREMPPTRIQITETENVNTIEQYLDGTVKIKFDHSKPKQPPLLKYNNSRHSFSGSSSTSKRDQGINEYLNQLNLNKQKDLEKKDIKQKRIKEENPQVNSVYYSVNNQNDKHVESDNESLNPTFSDMDGEITNQLNTIKKLFEINWNMLNSEFDSEKNKEKRIKHSESHTKEEKKIIFDKWKNVKQDLRMNIHFFDFVENYYPKLKNLNVLTTTTWTKQDKALVESSHPPKENILIKVRNELVKSSSFKLPPTKLPEKDEERKIIEQNNYTNKCLNTIGDQLDKIENKIDSINTKPSSIKIETPLIKTQELKPGLSLKTNKTKTSEKIDQMLKEIKNIKTKKGEPSSINVLHKNEEVTVNTCFSNSETTSDEEINKLKKSFGKLQKITNKKPNPTSFTKNSYPRPTPPNMQFKERKFQHQFRSEERRVGKECQ